MATVRIGDFSGGTSEVLDPSLIAPNAAVASYNLDPRTGVFSPISGLGPGDHAGQPYIDFVEYDGGHAHFHRYSPTNFVRWGDYLLECRDLPFTDSGYTRAMRFDAATGLTSDERSIGMEETTEAENSTVSLRPVRATALTFADGDHNLTGDLLLNIERAAAAPAFRYQQALAVRAQIIVSGEIGDPLLNVSEGDWLVLPPQYSPDDEVSVARPMCVVEVRESEQTIPYGETLARPTARLIVSMFYDEQISSGNGQVRTIKRGSAFGLDGFVHTDSNWTGNGSAGDGVLLFKRASKTLQEIVAVARSIGSRVADGYIFPVARVTAQNMGAERLTVVQGLNFAQATGFSRSLYDYTVYDTSEDSKTLLIDSQDGPTGYSQVPYPYDIVLYRDMTPGAEEPNTAILGVLGAGVGVDQAGLSSGVYRYAFTRVDDWGRESAPWPYLLDDKKRPRIDASTEATATSTLGALFVKIGGMPPLPSGWKLNVYRTRADGADYFFHSKLETAVDFVDTVSDFDLSVVPMLAEQNYPPLVVPVDEEAKVFTKAAPRFLCEYRGTLFAAHKNRLMFGAPGRFFAWPPGNYVLLPSNITGILPAGDVLLVFTKTSTYRLVGNTFSTMDFRKVSDEYGCVNHRTACLVDRRPMWCSLNGVATFDGVRVSVITDGLLQDNSAQFRGATSACSYRGEYFLLLTPTLATPTRTAKGEPVPAEIEPRERYFLRIKPGAWATHGVFIGNATDIRPNPSDGKLYVVHKGAVAPMFEGPKVAGYWKSGRLHGGFKTLRKNGQKWFAFITDGSVRIRIVTDRGTEAVDKMLEAGDHFVDFKPGVFFRDLTVEITGAGTVTEFGFEFEEGRPQ